MQSLPVGVLPPEIHHTRRHGDDQETVIPPHAMKKAIGFRCPCAHSVSGTHAVNRVNPVATSDPMANAPQHARPQHARSTARSHERTMPPV